MNRRRITSIIPVGDDDLRKVERRSLLTYINKRVEVREALQTSAPLQRKGEGIWRLWVNCLMFRQKPDRQNGLKGWMDDTNPNFFTNKHCNRVVFSKCGPSCHLSSHWNPSSRLSNHQVSLLVCGFSWAWDPKKDTFSPQTGKINGCSPVWLIMWSCGFVTRCLRV